MDELRGGDMLTGLLEELKPGRDEEEKTVYEYAGEVSEALHIAAGEGVTSRVVR